MSDPLLFEDTFTITSVNAQKYGVHVQSESEGGIVRVASKTGDTVILLGVDRGDREGWPRLSLLTARRTPVPAGGRSVWVSSLWRMTTITFSVKISVRKNLDISDETHMVSLVAPSSKRYTLP
jgi:hypothetical protein